MKPQPGYIPSPYPIGAELETVILTAVAEGDLSSKTAKAMIRGVAYPLCRAHGRAAAVLWGDEPCCEACAQEQAAGLWTCTGVI